MNTAKRTDSMWSISARGVAPSGQERGHGLGTVALFSWHKTEGPYCPWYLVRVLDPPPKTVLYVDAFRVKTRGDSVLQNAEITGELPR